MPLGAASANHRPEVSPSTARTAPKRFDTPASSAACSLTVRSLVDVVDASDATAGPHRQVVRPVASWR